MTCTVEEARELLRVLGEAASEYARSGDHRRLGRHCRLQQRDQCHEGRFVGSGWPIGQSRVVRRRQWNARSATRNIRRSLSRGPRELLSNSPGRIIARDARRLTRTTAGGLMEDRFGERRRIAVPTRISGSNPVGRSICDPKAYGGARLATAYARRGAHGTPITQCGFPRPELVRPRIGVVRGLYRGTPARRVGRSRSTSKQRHSRVRAARPPRPPRPSCLSLRLPTATSLEVPARLELPLRVLTH